MFTSPVMSNLCISSEMNPISSTTHITTHSCISWFRIIETVGFEGNGQTITLNTLYWFSMITVVADIKFVRN